ncbi:ABC transporter substrate-binding protein [Cohnella cellulosilytica]|uniref:ABC transporter substrate-binding protein n=1 Tax=Cohnella cellulosilytica TaxID=986710 RepID=A0ABW2FI94_9BACL
MKKRTGLVMLVALTLVFGILSGCTKGKSEGNSSGSSNDSGTQTEIVFWQPDLANWQPLYNKLVKKFEESHPTIKVKMTNIPEDGYFEKLNTAFAAGKGPDIWVGWYATDEFDRGYIAPIDEFIEADDWDMSQYFQPIVDLRLKGADGKHYGLPRDYSSYVFLYNKDLFDKAQIPYPTDDWTFEEFRNIAKQLTDADSQTYGTDIVSDGWGDSPLLWSLGGDMISDDGWTVKGILDSPQTVKWFELGQQLVNDGSSLPTSIAETMTGDNGPFGSGKVAISIGSMWGYNSLKDLPFEFGAVSYPQIPGSENYGWADVVSWFMNAKSKHQLETWQFMKFMSSTEIAQEVVEEMTWGPPIPSIWVDQKLIEDDVLKVFYDQGKRPTKTPTYVRSNSWQAIENSVMGISTDTLLPLKGTPLKDPQEVLSKAADEIQKILDETKGRK